jgi:N-acetylglucosaminyl-diphospho-decaprenol L-rhamnosyltransferase
VTELDTESAWTPPSTARLGIVVVTFGAAELLDENLATIDTDVLAADVVIVDNFHSTAARNAISAIAHAHGWTVLPMSANLGFGAAANHGVRHAESLGCSSFLLLNPDARISADSIRELWHACESAPMTMQSPRIIRPDGTVWFRGGNLDVRSGIILRGDDGGDVARWLTGACLMVHRDLWRRLGGFDPDFFMYWEDVDLSRRALAAGGRLRVRPELTAVHEVGGTQDAAGKSSGYYYFNCRNRLLFAAKHLPAAELRRWIIATPSASMRVMLRGGGRRRLLTSPATVWAGLRGSAAGLLAAVVALVRRP